MAKTENNKEHKASSVRNIFALGFVSFFTDMSSEMVFSILPAFLLGLPGSSRAILGLIEGTAEALSYCLRAVSGIFLISSGNGSCLFWLGTLCRMLLSLFLLWLGRRLMFC